jgi:S1-C subfamily serine protease
VDVIVELEGAIRRVASSAGRSVVGIGARRRGTGVVIAPGKVLTNAHNLRGPEVTVTFAGGRSARASVSGLDPDGDLAVVDIDTGDVPPLEWGSAERVTQGSVVFGAAATNAAGVRVTVGTVSAVSAAFRGPRGRRIAGNLEHTAPLAPGSSGGPLLDSDGRIVGINTSRLGDAFYLARPADAAFQARVDELSRGASIERFRLGIAVAPAEVARRLRRSVGLPERTGLLVREVEEDGPAAAAGVAEGDLIVSVAGSPVEDPDALLDAIEGARPPFEVGIVRGTEERTVTIAPSAGSADNGPTPGTSRGGRADG